MGLKVFQIMIKNKSTSKEVPCKRCGIPKELWQESIQFGPLICFDHSACDARIKSGKYLKNQARQAH